LEENKPIGANASSERGSEAFAEVRRRLVDLDPPSAAVFEQLEREVRFLELLQQVSFASNASSRIEEPIQTCLDLVCEVVGWPIGHAWLRATDAPELLTSAKLWHLPTDKDFGVFKQISEGCRFRPGVGLPGRVLESGKPAWIVDVIHDKNFPRAKLSSELDVRAGFAFPVLVEDEVLGVLEFFSSDPAEPDASLLGLMAQVGTQLGRVFERKRNEERIRLVTDVNVSLSESLDPTVSLERLVQPLVPTLADWCMVDVFEGDELRTVAFAHRDGRKRGLVAELAETSRKSGALPGVDAVVRSGDALFAATLDEATVARIATKPEHLRIFRELVPRSLISVPLEARGVRLGALTCVLSAPMRRYRPAEFHLMLALAQRASLAIDNARLYRNAQQAIRIREEVVAMVSHDLKNPLSVILGNAQLLELRLDQRTDSDDVTSKLVSGMLRAGDRMHRLIHDLLDMAIIEGNQLILERVSVNAVQLVKESIELHEPLFAEKNQKIEFECDIESVSIFVDRDRIMQAISNLFGNAIKFSPAASRIAVSLSRDDSTVSISVSDQGPGIPVDMVEDIFKRYWQGSRAFRRDGTGLGLFITRSIIEAHGGTIRVTKTSTEGATFTIALPLATQ
jgi:signal transduction histidine kinase